MESETAWNTVANYDPGLATFMQDLLDAAKAKLFGLDGVLPSRNYTKDPNPEYDPNTEYFSREFGDYSPLPRRHTEMRQFDEGRYEKPSFKTDRETLEDYMNRISVTDIPENLLLRDDTGRIIGMREPRPTYILPDRRGSQTFAP